MVRMRREAVLCQSGNRADAGRRLEDARFFSQTSLSYLSSLPFPSFFFLITLVLVQGEGSQTPGLLFLSFFSCRSYTLLSFFVFLFLISLFFLPPFSFSLLRKKSCVSHLYYFDLHLHEKPGFFRPERKCCIFRLKSVVRSSSHLRACWNFVYQLLWLVKYLHVKCPLKCL